MADLNSKQRDPLEVTRVEGGLRLAPKGDWTIDHAAGIFDRLELTEFGDADAATVDLSELGLLDTTGAWLLHRTMRHLRERGASVVLTGESESHAALISLAQKHDVSLESEAAPHKPINSFVSIGVSVEDFFIGCHRGLSFLGVVISAMLGSLFNPRRLAIAPIFHHMEVVGFRALPIVGLISFLIGLVIAYQGILQLRLFGAEVFVVELVGVSVLRELAILLTAIVVAGRSGSAFTAQIGSMKLHEEIDAMRTLGLDPIDRLVVPRVLALLFMLPLLGFYADIMGLLGGAFMIYWEAGISLQVFMQRLTEGLVFSNFAVGIMKAPAFALVISLAGCYEGLQVEGGAESVGYRTTKSVVESIFMIIVLDALFSIVFAVLDI